ncbi:transglutaminase domain-containing protein [Cohnella panacarvi]|uniref:transglutaminase domain-containing protein n=1 Tax=Cohnella panacarvi TaxID=400776 RepID=UPI00047E16A3|nr:transglutaminase domain-containing protein [Cohnella panacarvi]
MNGNGWGIPGANVVTWIMLLIVAISLLHGVRRGASGSAKHLLAFLLSAVMTVAAIAASALLASALSPRLQAWLAKHSETQQGTDHKALALVWHTVWASLRDLPLLRFSVLFFLIYLICRLLAGVIAGALASVAVPPLSVFPAKGSLGRLIGGIIGALLGTGRVLLFTAVLFAYCAIFPRAQVADYIEQSGLYREVAAQVIEPAAGTILGDGLPVLAQAFNDELGQLWQRRYDVIDANLPKDITAAAASVTEGMTGDEQKAKALYDWVGSRISYDYDKADAYIDRGEWREQDPGTTFDTRMGVCIDYARLYAAMARSVGLQARVVTGLGYDGRGGYGPHAWNEAYIEEQHRWIPLDATWAQAGNWFDVAGFADTHIEQTLS